MTTINNVSNYCNRQIDYVSSFGGIFYLNAYKLVRWSNVGLRSIKTDLDIINVPLKISKRILYINGCNISSDFWDYIELWLL